MVAGENIAPRFTQKPSLRQEGTSIVFNCEIEASPEPSVVWYRGDTVLQAGGRTVAKVERQSKTGHAYTLSLVVENVSADDSGTYKVEAKNKLGQMAANINLNLQAPPTGAGGKGAPSFVQKPAIKQIEGGKKILFECKIAADPLPVMTWYRDNIQLSDGGRYRFITKEESAGQYYVALELSDPQPVDGATYKLNTKNQFGESNANLKLNFDVPAGSGSAPKFTAKPSIQMSGSGVVFQVALMADPAPQITWYNGTKVIQHGGRYNIVTRTDGLHYVIILEISDVTTADGGTYKVNAKNSLGESNANLNLNLESGQKGGSAPTFTEKPSIRQDAKSGAVIFEVRCTADPDPAITWFKEGIEISAGERYKITTRQEGGVWILVLELSSVQKGDGGAYKVNAKNSVGEANANLNLNLEGMKISKAKMMIPSMRGEPLVEQRDGKLYITYVCESGEKPSSNFFFNGKPIKIGGRYMLNIEQDGPNYVTNFVMDKPVDKDSGEYKCVLKNSAGEIVKLTTVKVQAPGKKGAPEVPKEPKVEQRDGKVFIRYIVESGDKPTANFFYNGKPVKIGGRYTMNIVKEGPKYAVEFEMDKPLDKDSGEYKCVIKNSVGEITKLTPVKVEVQKDKKKKKEEEPQEVNDKMEAEEETETKTAPKGKKKPGDKKPVEEEEVAKTNDKKAETKPVDKVKVAEEEVAKTNDKKAETKPADKKTPSRKASAMDGPIPTINVPEEEAKKPKKKAEPGEPGKVGRRGSQMPDQDEEDDLKLFKTKPKNQVVVEGDDMTVSAVTQEPQHHVRFVRGGRVMGSSGDPRISADYNKTNCTATLTIKKCKMMDESKYKAEVMDEDGKVIDFAGFSVFVKNPKDSGLDFRSLLKHKDQKGKRRGKEGPDWGDLKPTDGDEGGRRDSRRLSQIELMKGGLRKVSGDKGQPEPSDTP